MQTKENKANTPNVDELFAVGAHFGYTRSRRHPTVSSFIYGAKQRFEIIDLEKTADQLAKACAFVAELAKDKKQVLFVSSKQEAKRVVKEAAEKIGMPYVAGRWIGGSLTNFPEIRKRVEKLTALSQEREKGLLAKYTKKERLMIDREIDRLEATFSGLVPMVKKPHAMIVVDSRHEDIAVDEARQSGIPVIALTGTDCDLSRVDYPIVANDSLEKSISYVVNALVEAYKSNVQ
jgi:small subunit ribosomal protein S2